MLKDKINKFLDGLPYRRMFWLLFDLDLLFVIMLLCVAGLVISATPASKVDVPAAAVMPTYTTQPTLTPYPTHTPYPTATNAPTAVPVVPAVAQDTLFGASLDRVCVIGIKKMDLFLVVTSDYADIGCQMVLAGDYYPLELYEAQPDKSLESYKTLCDVDNGKGTEFRVLSNGYDTAGNAMCKGLSDQ